ncbi:MCE family protein [Mycobacterium novum]
MHLDRKIRWQLVFLTVITLLAGGLVAVTYLQVPSRLFGVGHYQVVLNLPAAAGLYPNSNVTYRGTEVGRVEAVRLSVAGVEVVMSLRSDTPIPADVDARVRSQTAAGEQFVDLVPRGDGLSNLMNGSVITVDRATTPPDINELLSATNSGLQAIPHDNLKTAVDEAFIAVGGLGPELARVVKSSTALAMDAHADLDALINVIDHSKPILDTQVDTSDSIQAWAANLSEITKQLHMNNDSVKGILDKGFAAADEGRQLFDQLHPTLPIVLANLVSLADVAVVYQPSLEQLMVLLPRAVEMLQGAGLANRDTKQDYRGIYLSFNLNLNLPPPCTTGYLPAQQMRTPSEVDYPERPRDLYCRVPQDSIFNVRGARNLPCITRPGKRAPTVKMCDSEENYVPLNDGFNWKGDPNATSTGQDVPQLRPGEGPTPDSPATTTAQPPPIAVAHYDPGTGSYVGPDGRVYTQANLANTSTPKTWEAMLVPPLP